MKTTMFGTIALVGALALTGCSSDGVGVDADVDAEAGLDGEGTAEGEAEGEGTAEGEGEGEAEGDVSVDVGASGSVSFGGIEDGATVSSPVTVSFESDGFDIIPAAEGGGEASGHMHVMIDVGCVAVGETIPNDESHVHFGDGSTSAELELEPGEHTLCLQAGDGDHVAMDVTDEATVTVE